MRRCNIHKERSGMMVLLSMLIVGVVVLTLVLTLFMLSVTELEKSSAERSFQQTRALANICAEEALNKIRNDPSYQGDESYWIEGKIGEEGCIIWEIEEGNWSSGKVLRVAGMTQQHTLRMEIEVSDHDPIIDIVDWREVPSFDGFNEPNEAPASSTLLNLSFDSYPQLTLQGKPIAYWKSSELSREIVFDQVHGNDLIYDYFVLEMTA